MMRYCAFTVMLPEWTPEEAAGKLAAAGYQGVEWRVTQPSTKSLGEVPSGGRYWVANRCTIDVGSLPGAAAAVREMTERAGLAMPALGTYVYAGDLEAVERLMQSARTMGCPMIRVGAPSYNGSENYNAVFDLALKQFEAVEKAARQYGVKATVEVHMDGLTPSPSLAHRLASNFDPDLVGVLLDAGNMVYEGFENYSIAVDLLGPYLAHVHVKNAAWKPVAQEGGATVWKCDAAAMWEGAADYRALLRALRRVGYDGYLSFEDFSEGMKTADKLERNIAYMRHLEEEVASA